MGDEAVKKHEDNHGAASERQRTPQRNAPGSTPRYRLTGP